MSTDPHFPHTGQPWGLFAPRCEGKLYYTDLVYFLSLLGISWATIVRHAPDMFKRRYPDRAFKDKEIARIAEVTRLHPKALRPFKSWHIESTHQLDCVTGELVHVGTTPHYEQVNPLVYTFLLRMAQKLFGPRMMPFQAVRSWRPIMWARFVRAHGWRVDAKNKKTLAVLFCDYHHLPLDLMYGRVVVRYPDGSVMRDRDLILASDALLDALVISFERFLKNLSDHTELPESSVEDPVSSL